MVALAVLDIPGSIWSDRYGSGWKRARFQVPLVLGYTALSFISGIKAISHGLTAFVLLRVGVNLGAGWGEPVGVSNTAEWWPKEKRGFALGVHHTGYPIGALLRAWWQAWCLPRLAKAAGATASCWRCSSPSR